jgi:Spx/MgsR family transcriptional regulator
MIVLYGLKSCDACRKARRFLADSGREHRFHDLRADSLSPADLDRWVATVGWERLLNRRGTTWRQLDPADRDGIDEAKAMRLMLAHPALVKRPVMEAGDRLLVGVIEPDRDELASAAPM